MSNLTNFTKIWKKFVVENDVTFAKVFIKSVKVGQKNVKIDDEKKVSSYWDGSLLDND